MKKCPICNQEFENHSLYANHMRWKHKDNSNYIEKITKITKNRFDEKFGYFVDKIFTCECCKKEFIKNVRELKNENFRFCSSSCANTKKHSIDTKNKIRLGVIQNIKKQPGKENFILEIDKNKICKNCGNIFHTKKKKSLFCCKSCSMSYRYRDNRNKMSDKKKYKLDCEFKFNLSDYPEEFNFELIKTYGWYKAKNHGNNLDGISRDHIYSIEEGFKNKIDPKIISHPANCKLIKQKENSKKHSKSSITIEELLIKIEMWNKKYYIK
jgi:predicted  nucleic acid-binding Zn-ribbon protein